MYDEPVYVLNALRRQVDAFVVKATDLEGLVKAIKTVHAGGPYVSPSLATVVAALLHGRERGTPMDPYSDLLTGRERELVQLVGQGVGIKEIAALLKEAKESSRPLRGEPGRLSVPPALQSQIPADVGATSLSLVGPPYNWDWTATGYAQYTPDPLSALTASADRQTGALSFDQGSESSHAFSSYAAAAVGFALRPQVSGLLTVSAAPNISDYWVYWSAWAGSNTRGWVGFLVQAYDTNNLLVATPFYQQIILFDEGSNGGLFWESDFSSDTLNPTINTSGFVVSSQLWYAIWFWCGGDVHPSPDTTRAEIPQ